MPPKMICMIFGPSGHDHDPQNQLFLILETQKYSNKNTRKTPEHIRTYCSGNPTLNCRLLLCARQRFPHFHFSIFAISKFENWTVDNLKLRFLHFKTVQFWKVEINVVKYFIFWWQKLLLVTMQMKRLL